MTLSAFIAFPHLVMAQNPPPILPSDAPASAAAAPTPVETMEKAPSPALPSPEAIPNPEATPPLAEPVMELPLTPAPQIDAINLFPNQGEITSGAKFNDQRFGYILHGEARAAYESNIFISSRDEQEDFIFSISPGVAVGWGEFKGELYGPESFRHRFDDYLGKNYFFIDYSASYTWFLDHDDLNTFDNSVRLKGEWTIQRLTLGVRANYLTENIPDEDLGTRVKRARTFAALTSSYEYSGKTTFEVNAFYERLDYDEIGVNSQEWRNEDWLNYQISPKIKLGVGLTLAQVEREDSPMQDYEQARLRFIYEPSANLTAGLITGVEWRQTDGGEDRADGIFQLDLAWTPFDGSYFYLQGYRRSVTTGSNANEYYLATGVSARYRQRLFQRYYLSLTAGYQNAEYQSAVGTSEFGRSDDLLFLRPGVGFDLTSWLNCEISGEYRQNDSTIDRRTFDATTATLRFNVLF